MGGIPFLTSLLPTLYSRLPTPDSRLPTPAQPCNCVPHLFDKC
ncbi:hypothetical protein [Moorena sp. SIO3H5]|nr:hypothetical protein [Moorena sp. SIO3H5]